VRYQLAAVHILQQEIGVPVAPALLALLSNTVAVCVSFCFVQTSLITFACTPRYFHPTADLVLPTCETSQSN
jgi:hypothetical protein